MVHGQYDPVVPLQAAQQAKDALSELGVEVDYHEVTMGHEIQPEILEIVQSFLSKPGLRLGNCPETS
jgi:phospholipase/carboxylesterase